jgi:tetratricopeptide (TPR) repeat protein
MEADRYEQANAYLDTVTSRTGPLYPLSYKVSTLAHLERWEECETVCSRLIKESGELCPPWPFGTRGICRLQLGRLQEAAEDLRIVAQQDPEPDYWKEDGEDEVDHPYDFILTYVLCRLGRWGEAVATAQSLLARRHDHSETHHLLALLLASAPDSSVRDGPRGLQHAALAGEDDWVKYSLYAAAHAECGEFEQAIYWAEVTHEAAPEEEQPKRAARLAQYRRGEPHRITTNDFFPEENE